jgi:hypothetical protein
MQPETFKGIKILLTRGHELHTLTEDSYFFFSQKYGSADSEAEKRKESVSGLDDPHLTGAVACWAKCHQSNRWSVWTFYSVFSGSERPVKSYIRALASSFVLVGALGLVGCSPDNETEAGKSVGQVKDFGPTNPDAKKAEVLPPPKTQKEFFDRAPNPKDQAPTSTPTPKK